jgi:glycosyltransferase involved in cell wall biosynthesis
MTARDNDKIIAHKKFAHVSLNYLGQLSQKEVYQQMISNDIFCVPSLREGLGVANIEALSSKIPVVSTLAGGIPEVLDQGANGWLAKTNDSTDLAEQINACIQEAEQRYLKTAAGYNYIQEHFNYKVMLSNLYHTIKSNVKA